jgi:hypothetical protein
MQRNLFALGVFALLAGACGGGGSPVSAGLTSASSTTDVAAVSPEATAVVLSGSATIPGARAFGDPGFHEVIVLTGTVPGGATGLSGRLVISLHDVGRTEQTCDRDHPLSGCVTVDWSDFEDRPGVPAGGVFDNRLSVVSASGALELFLSEDRGLATTPDAYSPT